MGTLTAKVRENPMSAFFGSIILVTGLITGAVQGISEIDRLVITHAEHEAAMKPVNDTLKANSDGITDLKTWNKCARLEQRMDTLEDRLFNQRQSNTGSEVIHDIETELKKIERQFNAHNCARILAWNTTPTAAVLALN